MDEREPPAITLTSTTSAPITHSTTTTYTIGSRRNRATTASNTDTVPIDRSHLSPSSANRPTTPNRPASPSSDVEPFPAMPSPSPGALEPSRTADYFSQAPPPSRFQVRPRPIGIRRLPSATNAEQTSSSRPRSGSGLTRRRTNTGPSAMSAHENNPISGLAGLPGHYEIGTSGGVGGMESITEGKEAHHGQQRESLDSTNRVGRSGSTRLRRASNAARSVLSKLSDDPHDDARARNANEYESDVVDYLDVLDPEVSTLTTLTNVQNSLFVPDIPFLNRYINRRPTYELSRNVSRLTELTEPSSLNRQVSRVPARKPVPPTPRPPQVPPKDDHETEEAIDLDNIRLGDDSQRRASITSHVAEDHYAVLPHGVTLEDWSQEDVDALDDYVRHMLHSRRNRFLRGLKGFGKYIRKPLGFFVTLYAFLITVFGLIWVLFLIGWISLGERKDYIVNVIDNVLVALFAIMGDGLAPFRIIDTYHMIHIAHYHRLSWKIRKQKALPQLHDQNDLPERSQKEVCAEAEAGLEKETDADWEFSVLSPDQQRKLVHHQNKFSKSHSYYRPHETTTHHAFPLKLLITIVSLLDAHSAFQIALGSFTWAWSYHTRPGWITATILSCSITVNILAGVLISVGDKRTRKKDVLLRMARQGLTEEAMRKIEREKRARSEDVAPLKQTLEVTHAANVEQGVVEPRGNETKKGAEEVKEKLKGYKSPTDDSDGSDENGNLEKLRSGFETESYRTASNGEHEHGRI